MNRLQLKVINLAITIALIFCVNYKVTAKEIYKDLFEKFDPIIVKNQILDITDYQKINDYASEEAKIFNEKFIELHKNFTRGNILKEGINKFLKFNCVERKTDILTCEDVIHITIDDRNIHKINMIIMDSMLLSKEFENLEIKNKLTEVVIYAFVKNLEKLNKNINQNVMKFIPKGNALKIELKYPKFEKLIKFSDTIYLEKREDYRYSSPFDYFFHVVKYNEFEKSFLKTFENHGASEQVIIKDVYPSKEKAEIVTLETRSCGASSCGKWMSELIRYSNNEIKVNKFLGQIQLRSGNFPLVIIEKEKENLLGDILKIKSKYKIKDDYILNFKFKKKYENLINKPPFDYLKKDIYRNKLVKIIGEENFGKFRKLFKIANYNFLQDGRFLILRGTAKPVFNKHGIIILDAITEKVFAFEFEDKTMDVIKVTNNDELLKNKRFLFSNGVMGKHKCFSTKFENKIFSVVEKDKANCKSRLNTIH